MFHLRSVYITANMFGYDLLRKNPQDYFRCSRKIVNRNEIPIGISAAMDYSRCCALVFYFKYFSISDNSKITVLNLTLKQALPIP